MVKVNLPIGPERCLFVHRKTLFLLHSIMSHRRYSLLTIPQMLIKWYIRDDISEKSRHFSDDSGFSRRDGRL